MRKNFGNQRSGVIEYWCRSDYSNLYTELQLYELRNKIAFMFVMFSSGLFKVYDGTYHPIYDNVGNYLEAIANKWYHVKVQFNCYTGTARLWINGIECRWKDGVEFKNEFKFWHEVESLDQLEFRVSGSNGAHRFWLDSIDYS
ncbi:MAG: hypothetical protein ACTSRP_26445, partial [Candidatus Helarchaeota archaeon]